jgi:pyridoxamine 5'-phosphate oxidase
VQALRNDDFTRAPEPWPLFAEWFAQAKASEPNDPDAMALATVDPDGLPNVRMVLLKGADERGFVFYTNTTSTKGGELDASGRAALVLHWKSLRRQVRARGPISRVTEAEADAYFGSRHPQSRRGAWASLQSRPLESRAHLEAEVARIAERYPDDDAIPRPPHWTGYRIMPVSIEFWQDGANRLHDRVVFRRQGEGWAPAQRLFP